MKEIVQYENKVLRQKALEIKEFNNKDLEDILEDMFESLSSQEDGVALAAPQIGISKRIFVISPKVYDIDGVSVKEQNTVFINPVIIKKSNDEKLMDEGCLSVRYKYGKIRRSSRAKVEAYDQFGNKFEMEGTGLIAQIFQHEIDHLDGILFIDNAKDLEDLPPKDHE